jgi:hypothetical protein
LINTKHSKGIEAAVQTEPELWLCTQCPKNNPTHITIFEIYADVNAYQSAKCVQKYKAATKMVKSLELLDTVPYFNRKEIILYWLI